MEAAEAALCSRGRLEALQALRAAAGLDSRLDRGSEMLTSWLLRGSSGRRLLNGELDEDLREVVVCVSEHPVVYAPRAAAEEVAQITAQWSGALVLAPDGDDDDDVDEFKIQAFH